MGGAWGSTFSAAFNMAVTITDFCTEASYTQLCPREGSKLNLSVWPWQSIFCKPFLGWCWESYRIHGNHWNFFLTKLFRQPGHASFLTGLLLDSRAFICKNADSFGCSEAAAAPRIKRELSRVDKRKSEHWIQPPRQFQCLCLGRIDNCVFVVVIVSAWMILEMENVMLFLLKENNPESKRCSFTLR